MGHGSQLQSLWRIPGCSCELTTRVFGRPAGSPREPSAGAVATPPAKAPPPHPPLRRAGPEQNPAVAQASGRFGLPRGFGLSLLPRVAPAAATAVWEFADPTATTSVGAPTAWRAYSELGDVSPQRLLEAAFAVGRPGAVSLQTEKWSYAVDLSTMVQVLDPHPCLHVLAYSCSRDYP